MRYHKIIETTIKDSLLLLDILLSNHIG